MGATAAIRKSARAPRHAATSLPMQCPIGAALVVALAASAITPGFSRRVGMNESVTEGIGVNESVTEAWRPVVGPLAFSLVCATGITGVSQDKHNLPQPYQVMYLFEKGLKIRPQDWDSDPPVGLSFPPVTTDSPWPASNGRTSASLEDIV